MPNFDHEMLREIYQQPQALRHTFSLYLTDDTLKPEVAAAANRTCSTVQLLVPRLRDLGYSFLAPDWISESKRGID